jgi:hypothetical protein
MGIKENKWTDKRCPAFGVYRRPNNSLQRGLVGRVQEELGAIKQDLTEVFYEEFVQEPNVEKPEEKDIARETVTRVFEHFDANKSGTLDKTGTFVLSLLVGFKNSQARLDTFIHRLPD